MKLAVLTCSTTNRKWLYDITNPTKEKYCQKHNIDYIFSDSFYPDKSRHPYWNKIKMICDYLPKYDWVIWIDDDAGFINNTSIKPVLENSDKEFLYCKDMNGFNAGVMFIKNTKTMQTAFSFIWNKMYDSFKTKKFPEQDAIKKIINDLSAGKSVDGHLYNAYDKSLTFCAENQANENTIILHIAGGSDFKEHHKEDIKRLFITK